MQPYAANDQHYHLRSCNPRLILPLLFALLLKLRVTHTKKIVDGADQVTNALIAQWVAEDSHHARNQEEEVAVENKEEEE